jgi:hypothetical protein
MRFLITHHRFCTVIACAALVFAGSPGCKPTKRSQQSVSRYPSLPLREVPPYLKDTILERTDFLDTQPLPVSGFGLVARLRGTGNNQQLPTAVRNYIVKEMVKNGIGSHNTPEDHRVTPEEMLNDPSISVARVDALIPPGARKGDRFDVQVSTLDGSTTSSLAGGALYRTELKIDGANTIQPAYKVDVFGLAQGPVFVNPSYLLGGPGASTPAGKNSLRYGIVMQGGLANDTRPLVIKLRQPQRSMARVIEILIDERFANYRTQPTEKFAAAKDEGIVMVVVPRQFNGNWEHFAGIVSHMFLTNSPSARTLKAKSLADEAVKPGAMLEDISYAWEAIGPSAVPYIAPLMSSSSPDVAFAASRAAAYLGDGAAVDALTQIAMTKDNPFQLNAVRVLGDLNPSPQVNAALRTLLGSEESLVRIEAYKVLAKNNDPSIYSKQIGDKFILDIVPSDGKPIVYAARSGVPRLAIIGNKPSMNVPAMFSAMQDQLTISSSDNQKLVTIYYRGPSSREPVTINSNPDLAEIAARLGGEGPGQERLLNFAYGDIVAILQAICDTKEVTAYAQGQRTVAAFVLQEAPGVAESVYNAPVIGGDPGRPQ